MVDKRRFIPFLPEYVATLRARRHVEHLDDQTPEEALEFARTFRWRGGRIAPTQATGEILWLLDLIRTPSPEVIVEIGTDDGGTLFLWSRVAADDALIVAVDFRPLGLLGRWSAYAVLRRGFARKRQRIELIFGRDSHAESTVDDLRQVLGGRAVDFLFIDGDHSYEGVKDDFERYSPLVRPGGIVALHDVGTAEAPGVVRFWSELTQSHKTAIRYEQYGIGVVYV